MLEIKTTEAESSAKIIVIGVGGGGSNAVNRMIENDVQEFKCNKLLIDNFGGAKKAVNYLIKKKHKKIAHICGNPNKKVTIERFNGYIEAMQEAKLEVKDDYIQYSSSDYRSGFEKMNKFERKKPAAAFYKWQANINAPGPPGVEGTFLSCKQPCKI